MCNTNPLYQSLSRIETNDEVFLANPEVVGIPRMENWMNPQKIRAEDAFFEDWDVAHWNFGV